MGSTFEVGFDSIAKWVYLPWGGGGVKVFVRMQVFMKTDHTNV